MSARIAIITSGVKLNTELRGFTRYLTLADMLTEAGFEVVLITSIFQHWDKRMRNLDELDLSVYPFKIAFVYEPGYKKNISLQRVCSHTQAAKSLRAYLEQQVELQAAKSALLGEPQRPPFDLIYAEIPPNDLAASAAVFARDQGIPFIVDINDLWPEAMKMVFDVPLLNNLLFWPFVRAARTVYANVSGVVGTSDDYAAKAYEICSEQVPRCTVYVGNELEVFDAGVAAHKDKLPFAKAPDDFWVTYAGTLGTSYDIPTMAGACALLKARGYNHIKFIVLGDGPARDEFETHTREQGVLGNASGNGNGECAMYFLGYTEYDMMAAYLESSDLLVNSLVRKAPQSMVTKIADYLAAGKPIINTGSTAELRDKLEAQELGVTVEAQNALALANAVEELYLDGQRRAKMSANARRVSETEFDRRVSFKKLVDFVRGFVEDNGKNLSHHTGL